VGGGGQIAFVGLGFAAAQRGEGGQALAPVAKIT
jgi:hypothetical protein